LVQMAGPMLAGIDRVSQGFEIIGLLFLSGKLPVRASSRACP